MSKSAKGVQVAEDSRVSLMRDEADARRLQIAFDRSVG